jgi:hypothetical protein
MVSNSHHSGRHTVCAKVDERAEAMFLQSCIAFVRWCCAISNPADGIETDKARLSTSSEAGRLPAPRQSPLLRRSVDER